MMYHQAYPSSSPYLPPPPPNQNQLPPLSGFDARIPPSNTSPPISQPQSPNLRLNPNSNGLNTAHIIEPKVEKVKILITLYLAV